MPELTGAAPAMIADQAAGLRRLMLGAAGAELSRPPSAGVRSAKVVAIASGKGGVGKSVIAAGLSMALARRGQRVILVDADLGTANIDVMLNLQTRFNLSHVIRREQSMEQAAEQVAPGLRVVVGASGLASAADLDAAERSSLVDELGSLESEADVLIVDCGAGISQNVLAFAQAADELFVVTTPEPPALTDAYALIKVLSRSPAPPRIGVVVNQARDDAEGAGVSARLASVASRFLGLSIAWTGHVPADEHVRRSVRACATVVQQFPRCPAATRISALADRIVAPGERAARGGGFFQRVIRHFN